MLHSSINPYAATVFRVVCMTLVVFSFTNITMAQNEAGGYSVARSLFGNTSGPAVDVEISAVLKHVDGGRTELQVTALVPEGYYIYSMNPAFHRCDQNCTARHGIVDRK